MPDDEFCGPGRRSSTTPTTCGRRPTSCARWKEPVPDEYYRLGDATGPGPLHLPAPGRVCRVHRGPDRGRQHRHRLRDRAPAGQLAAAARSDERGGRRMAPLLGAHHLMRPGGGRGVLVCGVPGVRCARIVILGNIARFPAATMAVGMHSEVYVLDRNLDKFREVDHHFRGALETVAWSHAACHRGGLSRSRYRHRRRPGRGGTGAPPSCLTTLVEQMRPGSVSVDISVDQGGCFESTHPTTHSNPTFKRCTGRSSTAWPTCPVPCRTPRPTHWPTPRCPTPCASPNRGWREAVRDRPHAGRGGERGRGPRRLPAGGRSARPAVHAARRVAGLIQPSCEPTTNRATVAG